MIPMTHDPLCQIKNPHPDWTRCASCYFIAKVREDMLAKCINTVDNYAEERLVKTEHPNMSEDITAALRVAAKRLRALREEL